MSALILALRGKKTYIIAALTVILGLLQGDQNLVLQGLGFAALRSGVNTVVNGQ